MIQICPLSLHLFSFIYPYGIQKMRKTFLWRRKHLRLLRETASHIKERDDVVFCGCAKLSTGPLSLERSSVSLTGLLSHPKQYLMLFDVPPFVEGKVSPFTVLIFSRILCLHGHHHVHLSIGLKGNPLIKDDPFLPLTSILAACCSRTHLALKQ